MTKELELYKYGIDYYGISPRTIVLMNSYGRLNGIKEGDFVHIYCKDEVDWYGFVTEIDYRTITLDPRGYRPNKK
jgi:hypothetical protein